MSKDSMDHISGSFEKIDCKEITKPVDSLESLLNKAKTLLCKNALKRLKLFLTNEVTTDLPHLSEIYKDLIQSLDEEPELDHSLVYKVLGLDREQAELDNASNLANLEQKQIAGFSKEKLLEMLYFSKISYGDGESKLEEKGFKTRKQFKDEGYQIIKFYENELIQDEYCQDNGYKLEKRDVDCVLKADNSCTRDAGYVFIKDKEVTIAYHGTRDNEDNMHDLNALLTEVQFLDKKVGSIHCGFYSLFKRSWPNVHKILQGHANYKGLEEIKKLKINVTGHSMGGALATIAALCLKETENAEDVHVATAGSPRVLYQDAAGTYSKCLGEKTIRVAFQSDPVPCLPPGGGGQYYKHVGKPLKLETGSCFNLSDHSLSKYLEFIGDIKQEIFKSDDNASKYFQLARLFGVVCSNFPKDIPFSNDKEFFEKVKEENKDIKFSEIPSYILKSEEELKQKEQELNGKVAQLTQDKSQLKETLQSTQQSLNEKTEKLNSKDQELDDANQKLKEFKNTQAQFVQEKRKLNQDLNAKAKELESTKAQLEKLQKELDAKTKEFKDTEAQLEQERNSAQQILNEKTQALESTQAQLTEKAEETIKLNDEVIQLVKKEKALDNAKKKVSQLEGTQQDLAKKINELESKEANLENSKKELDDKNQALNAKIQTLESIQTQLEQDLVGAKQELVEKTKLEEDLKQAEQNASTLNDKVDKKQMDDAKQDLTNKTGEESQIQSLQKQLESKNKELTGKNEKFLGASTHSKRQGNYASVSFVLSGAFAVGASLTMFHLAICITLAVAALTFLAVGFYCSYKANTALSNVEVENGIDSAAVEV